MKAHFVLLTGLVALGACSKPAPRHFDQLKISYKKLNGQLVQRQIPVLSAVVTARGSNRLDDDHSWHPYVMHVLCLANYDLAEEWDKRNPEFLKDVPPDQDLNPLEVCINVNDREGTDVSVPFKPGIYFVAITKDQEDRVSGTFIYLDKQKKSYVPFALNMMTGSLKVDAISDDAIVGDINLNDADNSITGSFNLKPRIVKPYVLPQN